MYKIGKLYIKQNNKNNYLKNYEFIDINLNENEYISQFDPFYYSDNFTIFKNYNDGATPSDYLYIHQNTIFDKIKSYLGIKKEFPINEDNEYEEENIEINNENILKYDCDFDLCNANICLRFKNYNINKILKCNLPQDVINYLDLELKYIKYTWDSNSNNTLYNLKGSIDYLDIETLNNNYNTNKPNLYIFDFWKQIDNITNYNFDTCLNINFDEECYNLKKILNNNLNFKYLINYSNFEICAILCDDLNININDFKFNINKRKKELQNKIEQDNIKTCVYNDFKNLNYDRIKQDNYKIYNNEINSIKIFDDYSDHPEFVYKIKNSNIYSDNVQKYQFNNKNEVEKTFNISYSKNIETYWFKNEFEYDYVYRPYDNSNKFNGRIFIYTQTKQYYKINNKFISGYNINKNIPDIITLSSNLFKEIIQNNNYKEVYNLDLTKDLKMKNKFLNYNDSKKFTKLIHYLIAYVKCDISNEFTKSIFYNLFYLKMLDIIDIIEIITRRKINI